MVETNGLMSILLYFLVLYLDAKTKTNIKALVRFDKLWMVKSNFVFCVLVVQKKLILRMISSILKDKPTKLFISIAAFFVANAIIAEAASAASEILVIDEVGKLELEGKGLYNATKNSIETEAYKNGNKILLLVVRDYLYEQAISFLDIKKHILIHRLDAIRAQQGEVAYYGMSTAWCGWSGIIF